MFIALYKPPDEITLRRQKLALISELQRWLICQKVRRAREHIRTTRLFYESLRISREGIIYVPLAINRNAPCKVE